MRTLAVLVLLLAAPLSACLWDYDTLEQESRGMGDLKAVIVGGFARNPALYYEMRLERVTKLLAEKPDDLDAYDAAGVACDRLGRSDEAIEWMARKLAAMDRMGYDGSQHAQPNHRYRYLANLGTFHAHRWFKNGAKREDMADMLHGRELIARAIKENPDAHFGREKYQLRIMDWVIALKPIEADDTRPFLQTFLGEHRGFGIVEPVNDKIIRDPEAEGALQGLQGLMTMGAAWESVDVLFAMHGLLFGQRKSSFAYFVELRIRELVNAGKRSLTWPADLQAEDALDALRTLAVTTESETATQFRDLRAVAEAWHQSRTEFMTTALQQGRHPDTHADFWEGFHDNPDQVPLPSQDLQILVDDAFGWLRQPAGPFILGLGLVFLVPTGGYIFLRIRKSRKKAAVLNARN